jgi:uncharacterized protein YxjI
MGLFGHGDGRRFVMREKLLSIGDDFWIEDDGGQKVFKVDGKAMRVRKTFVLEDTSGNEVAHIQDRALSVRGTMKVERGGQEMATVHKALVGIRDRFDVEDGEDLKAKGNVLDHEYEIKRDGDVVATVSKKWVRVRETYGLRYRDRAGRGRGAAARHRRGDRRACALISSADRALDLTWRSCHRQYSGETWTSER